VGDDKYFIFNLIENTGENMNICDKMSTEEKATRFNKIQNIICGKTFNDDEFEQEKALSVMPDLRSIAHAFSGLMILFSNSLCEVGEIMTDVACNDILTKEQVKCMVSEIVYKISHELEWVMPILESKGGVKDGKTND
jgi:hypothetical protein